MNALDRFNVASQMHNVAFRAFLWPSYQVSSGTCTYVAPSTHSFHNTTEGKTHLHGSAQSRLSQATTYFSGMWRQQMWRNILHGCHFDTVNSFCAKKSISDIFDRPSQASPEAKIFLNAFPVADTLVPKQRRGLIEILGEKHCVSSSTMIWFLWIYSACQIMDASKNVFLGICRIDKER